MNEQSRIDVVTDENLEQVTGGMDCNSAKVVGRIYLAIGDIFIATGDNVMGALFIGKAQGILVGACPN